MDRSQLNTETSVVPNACRRGGFCTGRGVNGEGRGQREGEESTGKGGVNGEGRGRIGGEGSTRRGGVNGGVPVSVTTFGGGEQTNILKQFNKQEMFLRFKCYRK